MGETAIQERNFGGEVSGGGSKISSILIIWDSKEWGAKVEFAVTAVVVWVCSTKGRGWEELGHVDRSFCGKDKLGLA